MIVSPATDASTATYGQEVLAAVLLAEARGEGEVGMRAVAEVVRRRADAKGVSMLSVLRPGAFSSLNGTDRDALLRRFHGHALFPKALAIARMAYNRPEALGDLTRGANHFTHKRERPVLVSGPSPRGGDWKPCLLPAAGFTELTAWRHSVKSVSGLARSSSLIQILR